MVAKLKTGDTVRVILGKDRGKKGKVLAVLPRGGRIIVEGISMVKKHVRARRAGEKGQRVAVAAPLPLSNVQFVCPQCKRGARLGIKRANGERIRVCRNCEAELPNS
jgi:large subunit ribosomal protein L24